MVKLFHRGYTHHYLLIVKMLWYKNRGGVTLSTKTFVKKCTCNLDITKHDALFSFTTYFYCPNNGMCEFFLEFCTNMYMVGWNGIKCVDNELIKSMYMMVKHVHDMYMSWHAWIVNPSCICYVYVRQTYTWIQNVVL